MTAPAPKKRGPYAPTLRRKAEMAEAALAIVDADGPESVSAAAVAERTGANEATVTYHFPTKDHLLVAALELLDERMAHEAGVGDPEAETRLERVEDWPEPTEQRKRLVALLQGQAAIPGHPAREYLRRRTDRAIDVFTRIVRRRQEVGLAHPGIDPAAAAAEITALMAGLDVLEMLGRPIDRSRAVADAFRRLTGANWMEARTRLLDPGIGL